MYKKIEKCRVCGNTKLETVVSLGEQVLTGVFPKDKEQKLTCGPLEIVKCIGDDCCGLVQLKHSYTLSEMYGENYGYRSGLNISMVKHLGDITNLIKGIVDLEDNDLVVDIGSNDSTLLRSYQKDNLRLVGIDPSGPKFIKYYPENVELIPDFFSHKALKNLVGEKKAKVITSIAMFYDLEEPLEFIKDIYDSLDENGVWVFEQSYLPSMLEANAYDTICHEHLEFYNLDIIKWMLNKKDFKVIDVQLNDTNGGSFLIVAAKVGSKYSENPSVSKLVKFENENGYCGTNVFKDFVKRIEQDKNVLVDFIKSEKAKGKKIYGYGASTKGNVLLQYCGITSDDIIAIADVNEDKYGCYTPNTNIPIISEKEAKDNNPDYFIVLPWHFKDMILEKEKEYIQKGGKFIFPLPNFEIIEGKQ